MRVRNFVSHAQVVQASVTSVEVQMGSKRPVATLEYAVNGQNYQLKVPTRAARLMTGQSVPVLYDPNNPQHAKRNTFWSLWVFPVCGIGIGLLVPFFAWAAQREKQNV
jgi:hypothetical protein